MLKKYLCWSALLHFFVLWGGGACLPPSVPGGENCVVLKISFEQREEILAGDGEQKGRSLPVDKGGGTVQGSNGLPEEKELNPGKKEDALLEEAGEGRRTPAQEDDSFETRRNLSTPKERLEKEDIDRENSKDSVHLPVNKEETPNPIENQNNPSQQLLVEEFNGTDQGGEDGAELPGRDYLINGENPIIDHDVNSTEGEEPKLAGGGESSKAYARDEEKGTSWGEPDQAPVLVQQRSPRYPFTARRKGWEGVVILLVKLEADGGVKEVGVLESSGYDLLDYEAVKAVSKWRYELAYKDGKPVVCQIKVRITFALKN